jgi:hypothetical protein
LIQPVLKENANEIDLYLYRHGFSRRRNHDSGGFGCLLLQGWKGMLQGRSLLRQGKVLLQGWSCMLHRHSLCP